MLFAGLLFLSGVSIGSLLGGLYLPGLYLICVITFALCLVKKEAVYPLALLIIFTGMTRAVSFYSPSVNDVGNVASMNGIQCRLAGVISGPVVFQRKAAYRPEIQFPLKTVSIDVRGSVSPVSGTALVRAYYYGDRKFSYGDRVTVSGILKRPGPPRKKGGFDYRQYLLSRGIHAELMSNDSDSLTFNGADEGVYTRFRRYLFTVKETKRDNILIKMPSGPGGIMIAMLLGERQFIPKEVKELFVRTGTMHILAISGLHVGVLAVTILWVLNISGAGIKGSNLITVCLLLAYALMIGPVPSVWRAVIMGVVMMLGYVFERKSGVRNSLGLALFLMLAADPGYFYQPGFILSFGCVASILYITPVTDRIFRRLPLGYLSKALSVSLAVWVGIFPLQMYYFGNITPSGILANLLAIPLASVILISGLCALVLAAVFPPASNIFFMSGESACNALQMWLGYVSRIPGGFVKTPYCPLSCVIIYYAFVIVIFMFVVGKTHGKINGPRDKSPTVS